jgi:hypothetical protein
MDDLHPKVECKTPESKTLSAQQDAEDRKAKEDRFFHLENRRLGVKFKEAALAKEARLKVEAEAKLV